MKIAILTSFFPSTVLPEEACQKYGLKKRHTFPWITNLAEGLAKFDSNDVHVITICNEFGKDFSKLAEELKQIGKTARKIYGFARCLKTIILMLIL